MLTLHEIQRSFGMQHVLRGVDLSLKEAEIICLLGPSGCGKTTLLRITAGLETADSGDVRVDGASIRDVPVHERGFGLMFQDFALFPHLDVAGNVAFGLKMQHVPQQEQRERVSQALERVNLAGYEKRSVATLSGGERQRVALARSLAPNPRLLMLDEPLGSLDAALRDELIVDLRSIIKATGLTTLYVTHDQREAYAIADRIAVMNAGRIEQIDTPTAIYQKPATEFVARFLGLNNIVPISDCTDNCARTPLGSFQVPDKTTRILLHPDGITIAESGSDRSLDVDIVSVVFQGSAYRLHTRHKSGIDLTFTLPFKSYSEIPQAAGSTLSIQIADNFVIPLNSP